MKKRKSVEHSETRKKRLRSSLDRKDREFLEHMRAYLIPNVYGFVAGVLYQPRTELWQGWISGGYKLLYISARNDHEQATADVEAFLKASTREGFGTEDALALLETFKKEGDAPPEYLPVPYTEVVLYYVRILYALKE